MYESAYAELDRAGCASSSDVRSALAEGKLSQTALAHVFYHAESVHRQGVSGVDGVVLVSAAASWPNGHRALKKAAVFGNLNTVLTDEIWYWLDDDYGRFPEEHEPASQNLDVWTSLVRFRALIERGLTYLLPKQIVCAEEGAGASGTHQRTVPPEGVALRFDLPAVRSYFENGPKPVSATSVLRIEPLMPCVEGVSLNSVLDLRMDEIDAYRRFQRLLNRKLRSPGALTHEREFFQVLVELDEAVRGIDQRHRVLRRKTTLEAVKIASGVAGMAICMTVATEFARALASVLGAVGVRDALRFLDLRVVQGASVELDPYYFAWLVHSRSRTGQT